MPLVATSPTVAKSKFAYDSQNSRIASGAQLSLTSHNLTNLVHRPSPHPNSTIHHVDDHGDSSADFVSSNPPQWFFRKSTKDHSALPSLQLHFWHKGNTARGRSFCYSAPETS